MELLFVCLAAHDSEFRRWPDGVDRRICQTFAASPAEPGELLLGFRPANIPQEKWEEAFAWPANNKPPYPPLAQRMLRRVTSYTAVVLVAAVLLQVFTPFSVLTWLGKLT